MAENYVYSFVKCHMYNIHEDDNIQQYDMYCAVIQQYGGQLIE